jgi:hypothetical protein
MSKDQEDFTKIGFVYAAILLVLSNVIATDWQNDEIFYLLGIYPYWTGLIFWLVIGYLSATLKPSFGGILCLSAVVTYNYGLIQKIRGADDETLLFIDRLWASNKLGVIIFTTFYIGGQLFIVSIIAKRNFAKSDAI